MPHPRPPAPETWPPTWPMPWSGFSVPPDLSMMLGRLLERSEHTAQSVDEIKDRLEAGDRKFDAHASRFEAHGERLDAMHVAIEKLQATAPKDKVTATERWSKALLTWGLPVAAAWWSGGAEAALKAAAELAKTLH